MQRDGNAQNGRCTFVSWNATSTIPERRPGGEVLAGVRMNKANRRVIDQSRSGAAFGRGSR